MGGIDIFKKGHTTIVSLLKKSIGVSNVSEKKEMLLECENCGKLIPTGKFMDNKGKWHFYKVSHTCKYCKHRLGTKDEYGIMIKRVYFK